MRRRLLRGMVTAWVALFLAVPVGAGASGRGLGRRSAGFSMRASNGYLVSVDAFSREVRVVVHRSPWQLENLVEAEYTVPGTITSNSIYADLGLVRWPSLFRESRTFRSPDPTSPPGCFRGSSI